MLKAVLQDSASKLETQLAWPAQGPELSPQEYRLDRYLIIRLKTVLVLWSAPHNTDSLDVKINNA